MTNKHKGERHSYSNRKRESADFPPTVLVLILISSFGAGVCAGILLFGAFLGHRFYELRFQIATLPNREPLFRTVAGILRK